MRLGRKKPEEAPSDREQLPVCPHCGWTGERPESCLADVVCGPQVREDAGMEDPSGRQAG